MTMAAINRPEVLNVLNKEILLELFSTMVIEGILTSRHSLLLML